MKKIIGMAMTAAMLLSVPALAAGDTKLISMPDAALSGPFISAAKEQGIYVREVLIDKYAKTTEDGVSVLPIRAIAEALDYEVEWEQSAKTVTISTAEETVTITIGKTGFTTKDEEGEMDIAPILDNGTTYVSQDFVTEALGLSVDVEGWRISIDSQIDLRNENKTLEVKTGETFTIGLEENATTGFTWSYKADKEGGISLAKETVNAAVVPEGMTGAPSFHIWEMTADKAGTYTLTFTYDRSFSPSQSPVTYTYTIVVK